MRVGLDPLQEQIGQALRRTVSRAVADDRWPALVALEVFAFGVPAWAGGLNLGQRAAVLAAEELGRALATGPALDTMLAADALVLAGPGAGPRARLDALAAGRLRCAAAGLAASLPGAHPLQLDAEAGGWTLRGRGVVATLPHEADELLLAAGARAFLVPAARPGWTSRPLDTAIPRGLAVLTFTGLRLEPADELRVGLSDLVARGRLRQAAFLLGLAAAAHEAAVGHAHRRRQFGQRLIEFQAIGMRLAALAGRLAALRLLAQRAAWLADTGAPLEGPAAECLAMAAELALDATRDGIQVHGAAGMTHDSPAQAAYRVAVVEAVRWGRSAALWREAGRARLAELAASR
jgi:alkylation response protein AidB-like acyl-CoA dehydrogenase